AARHSGADFPSGWRDCQPIGAAVAVRALPLHQAPPPQIRDHRGEGGLVAPSGLRQLGLTDGGVAGDQREGSETPGPFPDILRAARECLERGFLRHAQVKPDPIRKWTEINCPGKDFAVPDVSTVAYAVRSVHRIVLL